MLKIFEGLANEVADHCFRAILENHTDSGDIFLNVNYTVENFHPDLREQVKGVFHTIVVTAVRNPELFDVETFSTPKTLGEHIAFGYFNGRGDNGFEMTSKGLVERKKK